MMEYDETNKMVDPSRNESDWDVTEPIQFVDVNSSNIFDLDITTLDVRKVNNHMNLRDMCKLYYYLNKNSFCYTSEEKPYISNILYLKSFFSSNDVENYEVLEKLKQHDERENSEKRKFNLDRVVAHNKLEEKKNAAKLERKKRPQKMEGDDKKYDDEILTNAGDDDSSGADSSQVNSCHNDTGNDETGNDDTANDETANDDTGNDVVPREKHKKRQNLCGSFSSGNSCDSSCESISSTSSYSTCSSSSSSSSAFSSNISEKSKKKNSMSNLKILDIINKYNENVEKMETKKIKKIKSRIGKLKKYDTVCVKANNNIIMKSQIYKFVKKDKNINIIGQLIYSSNECKKFLYNNLEHNLNRWHVLPCLGCFSKISEPSVVNKIQIYNFYEFVYLFNDFPLCFKHNKRLNIAKFEKRSNQSNSHNRTKCSFVPSLSNTGDNFVEEDTASRLKNSVGMSNPDGEETLEEKNGETQTKHYKYSGDRHVIVNCQSDERVLCKTSVECISSDEVDSSICSCEYDEDIILNYMEKDEIKRGKKDGCCSFRVFYYDSFLYKNIKIVPEVAKNCIIINRRSDEDFNFLANCNMYEKIRDRYNVFYDKNSNYVLTYKNFEYLYFFCFNCRMYYDINIMLCEIMFNYMNSNKNTDLICKVNKMYGFLQKYKKSYDIKIKRQKVKQTDIYFICINCIYNNVHNINNHLSYFSYFCDLVNVYNHNFFIYNEYVKSILNFDLPFFSLYNTTKEKALLTVQKKKMSFDEKTKNLPAPARNNNKKNKKKKKIPSCVQMGKKKVIIKMEIYAEFRRVQEIIITVATVTIQQFLKMKRSHSLVMIAPSK